IIGLIFTQAAMAVGVLIVMEIPHWMIFDTKGASGPVAFWSSFLALGVQAAGFWFIAHVPRYWREYNGHSTSGGHEFGAVMGGYLAGRAANSLISTSKLGQYGQQYLGYRTAKNSEWLQDRSPHYAMWGANARKHAAYKDLLSDQAAWQNGAMVAEANRDVRREEMGNAAHRDLGHVVGEDRRWHTPGGASTDSPKPPSPSPPSSPRSPETSDVSEPSSSLHQHPGEPVDFDAPPPEDSHEDLAADVLAAEAAAASMAAPLTGRMRLHHLGSQGSLKSSMARQQRGRQQAQQFRHHAPVLDPTTFSEEGIPSAGLPIFARRLGDISATSYRNRKGEPLQGPLHATPPPPAELQPAEMSLMANISPTDTQYLKNQQAFIKGFVPRVQDPIAHAQRLRGLSDQSPEYQAFRQHQQAHVWAASSVDNTAHFMASQLGYWRETPVKDSQGADTGRVAFHPDPQLMMQDPHYQDRWAAYTQTGVAPAIDTAWAAQHLSPSVQKYHRQFGAGAVISTPVSSLETAQQQGDAPATLISASAPIVFSQTMTPQGPRMTAQSIAWHKYDPAFVPPESPSAEVQDNVVTKIAPPNPRADDVRTPSDRARLDRTMYNPQADTQLNSPIIRHVAEKGASRDRGAEHLELTRRQLIRERRERPLPRPYHIPQRKRED
ncbi:MAG: hypothetical protein M1318_05770, partial [Firmicutes bacterium]|nr:hypothetical protein [Bacillota bacterium]